MEFIDYIPPKQENIEIGETYIDLRKIIASKNPKLLKIIPRFLLEWLKRLLHLKEINASIYKHRTVFGPAFATAILEQDIQIKVEVSNPQNIPTQGRVMIIANHPLGGVDGLALISEIGKYRQDILFPVNDLLMNLPGLKPIFIPINKFGRNTENQAKLDEAFQSKHAVLYFPAGLCSRKVHGEITDLEWKKTFIKKAVDYQRDITPVFVDTINSKFFYNLALFRKKIGIKANIELILLPSEVYKKKGKSIKLIFGKPILYTTFDKSKKDKEWASLLKEHVYKLKNNPNGDFKY